METVREEVNGMAFSKADSVGGRSTQSQDQPYKPWRVSGWDADGNPIIPFRKESRARLLQEWADEIGRTVDEVEMNILKSDRLRRLTWLSKSEWMLVDENAVDVRARLYVRTLLPEINPDYNPDFVSPLDPKTKLYAFESYISNCNSLCRELKPLKLQPGNVTYLVSVHPLYASHVAQNSFCSGGHGHPLAVIAEKVSFGAVSKARWELEKPIIRGELDITFLAAPPSEVFKVKETLLVEGTLVESREDSLEVKVDFVIKKTGKVGYTARTTFYTTYKKEWLAMVVSRADSVGVSSSQNQTSEMLIPMRRRISSWIHSWDADGNPIIPSSKESRAHFLQEWADETGRTLEEVEMYLLNTDKLYGKNWLSKSDWMPVDENAGGDVLARLHVRTLLPEIKPEYDPDLVSPFDPQSKLYAFHAYKAGCNALCHNIQPLAVQPGHVTYLVPIYPVYANLVGKNSFCSDGHPLAVIAEKVSFAAVSKARWELEKPIIRGELDIAFHAAPPLEVFKVKETLIVEGTLIETRKDSLEVKVDFIIEKTGKVGYTSRTAFYTTHEKEWL